MRSASTAVENLLATGRFVYANCYTITLVTGTVLRYTDAQLPLTFIPPGEVNPVTFRSNQVLMNGMKMNSKVGIEVDEQDVEIFAQPTATVDGQPFFTALRLGFFDGGVVKRDQAYLPDWGEDVTGAITLFVGRVSSVDPAGGTKAMMKVKSETVSLDLDMPRNKFQKSCKHTLFDGACGLDKNSYATAGTVEASSTKSIINWSSATSGYYSLGTIYFETGPNTGISATIRSSTGSTIVLVKPLEYLPETGNQFKAYPGCDLTYDTCDSKFSNTDNFRGFPFVPTPETAY